jgi:chitinase
MDGGVDETGSPAGADAGDAVASDAGGGGPGNDASDTGGPKTGLWSMGYYASWQPSQYPVSEIEWAGLTHLAVAFYSPQADGTLSLLGADPQLAKDIITGAHQNGVKAIASIGGSNSGPLFEQATAKSTLGTFVANLVGLLTNAGYDGIDIDWEPINASDTPLVVELAQEIVAAHPGAIMSAAVGYINPNQPTDLSGYPAIAAAYDQLNIMSYGMAGAWPGWNSWHNSPLYQKDSATPLSVDSTVNLYVAGGVPKAKLGVGIGFFGLCYSPPVTGPDQPLGGSTILASDGTMAFANIMSSYYSAGARTWDALARVPYLSFTSAHAPDGCSYISYDDAQSIAEKGAYVKSKGLGGVMAWELNEAYIASAPAGQRSPLLDAVRDNVLR